MDVVADGTDLSPGGVTVSTTSGVVTYSTFLSGTVLFAGAVAQVYAGGSVIQGAVVGGAVLNVSSGGQILNEADFGASVTVLAGGLASGTSV
jgi:hypothetical protein